MSELSDRVKDQLEQFNSSVDQVINASRGLYLKIKEESNKQFDELVKTGEAQTAEESFLKQLKEDITSPFDDVKSTVDQLKNAYIGLVVKTMDSSEKIFEELVELGASKNEKKEEKVKAPAAKASPKAKKKEAEATE